MLAPEQEKWIAHLSNEKKIEIIPYDPATNQRFEALRQWIHSALGNGVEVVHRGATSLRISGQGELDVYLPVLPENFDAMVRSVASVFGEPGSLYPLERARFVTDVHGTKAEVFVINQESQGWKNGVRFEGYLKANPEALEAYRKLKEGGNGLSLREYYRRKLEFINEILSKVL